MRFSNVQARLHGTSYYESERKRVYTYNRLVILQESLIALSVFISCFFFFYILIAGPCKEEIRIFGHTLLKYDIKNEIDHIKIAVMCGSENSGFIFLIIMGWMMALGDMFKLQSMEQNLKLSHQLYGKKIIGLDTDSMVLRVKGKYGLESVIDLNEYKITVKESNNIKDIAILDAISGTMTIPHF